MCICNFISIRICCSCCVYFLSCCFTCRICNNRIAYFRICSLYMRCISATCKCYNRCIVSVCIFLIPIPCSFPYVSKSCNIFCLTLFVIFTIECYFCCVSDLSSFCACSTVRFLCYCCIYSFCMTVVTITCKCCCCCPCSVFCLCPVLLLLLLYPQQL